MSNIRIAHHALGAFYQSSLAIVVAEDLYLKVEDSIPEVLDVFILSRSGRISTPSPQGTVTKNERAVAPIGMPIGLKAVLVTAASEEAGQALLSLCTQHKLFQVPALRSFGGFSLFGKKRAVQAFLLEVVAGELVSGKQRLSKVGHQLANLRGRYERLWLGYDMARRMLKGIGYDTRFTCFRLPPGDKVISGTSGQEIKSFRQFLPVDLAGFAGLNLYVPESEEAISSGYTEGGAVTIRIVQEANGSVVGQVTVPYRDIGTGWNAFLFDPVVSQVHGDGQLEILWAGDNGPSFAYADVDADRFGAENRSTLAMEVLRGLAEPSLGHGGRAIAEYAPSGYVLPPELLMRDATFLHGEAALASAKELLQGDVLSIDPCAGWLQAHLLPERATAIRLSKLRLENVQGVSARFEMGHKLAPPAVFVIMAVPKTMPEEQITEALTTVCGEDGSVSVGAELPSGVFWQAAMCTAGEAGSMCLQFDEAAGKDSDILLAVLSPTGEYKFGHARWTSIELLGEPVQGLAGHDAYVDEAGRGQLQQISCFRMSELSQHIGFIDGPAVLTEATQRLGFSPLSFNEETGAMQTHPFEGGPSAAIFYGGIPRLAGRVSVDVVSANEASPVFTYILAAIPSASDHKQAAISEIVEQVRGGCLIGEEPGLGARWIAAALPALHKRRLELDMQACHMRSDAVFIAIGLDGSDAYGWCRWYNLSISSSVNATSTHTLSRVDGGAIDAGVDEADGASSGA